MGRWEKDVILTDGEGRPLERPRREDFEDVVEYIRAVHAFNDRVTHVANQAFTEGFRKAMV